MKPLKIATLIGTVALGGIAVFMTLTNPRQDSYQDFAVSELSKYLKEEVCPQTVKIEELRDLIQDQCPKIVDQGRPLIQEIIAHQTRRDNFILFSIYRTNLDIGLGLPAYRFVSVGVLRKFYIYQAEEM
ncbi:MAG: DUF4359 domain-containing protein [Coleofasciculaceae cyanobacterium]